MQDVSLCYFFLFSAEASYFPSIWLEKQYVFA